MLTFQQIWWKNYIESSLTLTQYLFLSQTIILNLIKIFVSQTKPLLIELCTAFNIFLLILPLKLILTYTYLTMYFSKVTITPELLLS